MAKYTLSEKASIDLANIFQYTYKNFNINQAESYLSELEECFVMLSNEPDLAHKVEDIRSGYFRYLYRKHAVYFKVRKRDIFIIRVLHQQMKYELHLIS
ncbi:type II toxin-antitoxin system RelE/ParE family toxin [Candidatus Colwellia aromaticivorans]|uniref:type II toxin-antitoxin system RelE/ParE family toxin n=1 Tax=Candidatus Colwellia aromaticivorans TaxID=2267621 RepID=UPI000DF3BC67|nr:type II toxin-antitoxin system RelE/ParE family toxin [Candidatus Colwellia aromaticivorans]